MNYPVWLIPSVGGGLLIALISIIHVYVAHFAVGGGLFLVLTEMKAYREGSTGILEYTKRHAKFFLLLTMVFGSISGVGIWFIISLVHPAATSLLIHTFVFGWATEWVFFVGEIVSLFIYYYTFGKMAERPHLIIGWLYFIFAWLSLFVINGIVCFMLTPGGWVESGNFWAGFFNPSFLPSLCFRTLIALMLAGLFGVLTSSWVKDNDLRITLDRHCTRWLVMPIIFLPISSYWYLQSIPEASRGFILGGSPEIIPFFKAFIWVMPVIFILGLIMAIRLPRGIKRALTFVLLLLGLFYMGSFEWIREAARRPYVVRDYMYSTSVLKSETMAIDHEGMLSRARWTSINELNDANQLEAGQELFNLQCLPCHSVGGLVNDIRPRSAKFNHFGMDSMLNGLGKINDYMPAFMGTVKERKALATYIVEGINQKRAVAKTPVIFPQYPVDIPSFDEKQDEYILLVWNDLGMHCLTDNNRYFSILPPANTIQAQLIRRGETPEIVTEGVEITYQVEKGFENPSKHSDFWTYVKSLFGRDLKEDTGLTGNGLKGKMAYKEDQNVFVAEKIPVVPYTDTGGYNPYPLFTVEAKDRSSGETLLKTACVTPASTGMGCRNCHGGDWRFKGITGLGDKTAEDILKVHDRINKTDLYELAKKGEPKLCQSCHADPALSAEGDPKLLNLSAAMHGFHANYLTDRGVESCHSCHPNSEDGRTRCFRGLHAEMGLTCIDCHGALEDHALSLLNQEKKAGKKGVDRLMRHLRPVQVDKIEKINPRTPWINEPDCLNCHVEFDEPSGEPNGFNKWTIGLNKLYRNRTGEMGIFCQACHGSTHTLYPARNPYGKNRDVIQPLQYQNNPYPIASNKNCKVCHTIDMEDEVHHPNSLRMVRSLEVMD